MHEVYMSLEDIFRRLKEKDVFPALRWEYRNDGSLVGREDGRYFGLPYPVQVAAAVRPGPGTLVVLGADRRSAAASFVFNFPLKFFLRLRTRSTCSAVFRWSDVPPEYRPLVSEVLPQAPDVFFWRLGLWTGAVEFEWHEEDEEIVIKTPDPGFFIGRGGRTVRALQAHLGRRVRVERG